MRCGIETTIFPLKEENECAEINVRLLRGVNASARSHGTSATAIGSTIKGVADTCHTKSGTGSMTATGFANIHCHSYPNIAG